MPNRLAGESSAYLLQHKDNPVHWFAWGPEPWEKARSENKPVLVSIGYSSCHWCHVMERECFENEEIARVMNEHLICIKVDREERPDVDQIYMDAVLRMIGQGGWPLNMFCTPDGRPFHGGTYFPPDRRHGQPSWPELVQAVARAHREQPDEVKQQAGAVLSALQTAPAVEPGLALSPDTLGDLCGQLMDRADRTHGGFGAAPKFPTPTQLEAILAATHLRKARGDALEHLVFSLARMSRGGIYDQIGGGFHRYSVDAQWLVPHFEKMLYDNGQLLRVYAEAFRQTRDEELRWPVKETIDWLEREMRSPEGGFFASQDADSEGEEGRFFVWSPSEIREVLGEEDGQVFCDAYGVSAGGNFERTGKCVLAHGLAGERTRFAELRQKLFRARGARVAPDTDRKGVCAWIGYTIGGLASAGASFERPEWVAAAERAADFVLETLSASGRDLMRIWDGKGARVPGFLDDHGALLCGLLDLHRAGADERYLEAALVVADTIRVRFFDPKAGDLFFTQGGDDTLVFRPGSDNDGATPAAAGLATLGLARLGAITGRDELNTVVRAMLAKHGPLAARVPLHLPTLVRAGALFENGLGLGLILGEREDERTQQLARRARRLLGPEDAVLTLSPGERPTWLDPSWLEGREALGGAPTAYLCRGTVCSLPAQTPDQLQLPPTATA